MKEQRTRAYAITLNNWTEEELTQIHNKFLAEADKFIIGKEVGKKNGIPHLQMYVYWKNGKTLKQMKKINNRWHFEKAKGNVKHNDDYCSKENLFDSKGMETEVESIPVDERINNIMGFEKINNKYMYEKFIREVDPNLDGYEWTKNYLYNKMSESDFTLRKSRVE